MQKQIAKILQINIKIFIRDYITKKQKTKYNYKKFKFIIINKSKQQF
jgi:hypothetical protein